MPGGGHQQESGNIWFARVIDYVACCLDHGAFLPKDHGAAHNLA
jgi:hypothetical protein